MLGIRSDGKGSWKLQQTAPCQFLNCNLFLVLVGAPLLCWMLCSCRVDLSRPGERIIIVERYCPHCPQTQFFVGYVACSTWTSPFVGHNLHACAACVSRLVCGSSFTKSVQTGTRKNGTSHLQDGETGQKQRTQASLGSIFPLWVFDS